MLNALTIDVEEYFHPQEIQDSVGVRDWESRPSRVESQIFQILELLSNRDVRATFFVLGWVAERQPRCIRAIAAAGHEIGCHSYSHQMVSRLIPSAFRRDTMRAVTAI